MSLVNFYEVEFTNKLCKSNYKIVIGTEDHANYWAIKEASNYGFTYNVRRLSTENLDGIKNLCNL